MVRWEYLVLVFPHDRPDQAQRILNSWGNQGYELTSVVPGEEHDRAYLKRVDPKQMELR